MRSLGQWMSMDIGVFKNNQAVQVCIKYLLWDLTYVHNPYIGLSRSIGLGGPHVIFQCGILITGTPAKNTPVYKSSHMVIQRPGKGSFKGSGRVLLKGFQVPLELIQSNVDLLVPWYGPLILNPCKTTKTVTQLQNGGP